MEILDLAPDVVVVTEARRRFAGQLAGALADAGLAHALGPHAPDGVNGVMLVSRDPLVPADGPDLPPGMRSRWLAADLPTRGIRICGVHLPEAGRTRAHAEGWKVLLRAARDYAGLPAVLAGDLNTWRDGPEDRPRTGASATNLGRLASLGYADAWLEAGQGDNPSTWRGHRGDSFRLDYVLVSSPLRGCVSRAELAPEPLDGRVSDHAALVVDLAAECGKRGSPG